MEMERIPRRELEDELDSYRTLSNHKMISDLQTSSIPEVSLIVPVLQEYRLMPSSHYLRNYQSA